MEKHSLPEDLRSKASTAGGEQAWRMADVEDIILAARNLAMACIGGQVQFRFPGGTCEAYWVNFDSTERQPGEPVPVAQSLANAQTRHPVSRLLGPRSDGPLLITD